VVKIKICMLPPGNMAPKKFIFLGNLFPVGTLSLTSENFSPFIFATLLNGVLKLNKIFQKRRNSEING
jgi:hypothetical protein